MIATPPDLQLCAECLQLQPRAEMMEFPGFAVCAGCKPITVARLAQGDAVGRAWRAGKTLVLVAGRQPPDRCVYCNASAHGHGELRNVYWHHPAWYLTLLVLPLYIVVVAFIQKRQEIWTPICEADLRHRARLGYAFYALAALVFVTTKAFRWVPAGMQMAVVSSVLVLVGLVATGILKRPLWIKRMTTQHIFLRGAKQAFLQSLPEWPETKPSEDQRTPSIAAL